MRNTYKYIISAFLGLGICGGISVEFAHGMGQQFSEQDMRSRMDSLYSALKIDQEWLINFVQNKLDENDISLIMRNKTNQKNALINAIMNCDTQAMSLTNLLNVIGLKEGWSIDIVSTGGFECYGDKNNPNRYIVLMVDNRYKYTYQCVRDVHVSQNLSNLTIPDGVQNIENIDMSKVDIRIKDKKEEKGPKPPKVSKDEQEKTSEKKLLKQRDFVDDISEISFDEDGYSVYKSKDGSKGKKNAYFSDVIKRIKENPNDRDYVIKLFQDQRDAKKSKFTSRIRHLVNNEHVYFCQLDGRLSYEPGRVFSSVFAVSPITEWTIVPTNTMENQNRASYQILNSIYNLMQQGSFEIVDAHADSRTEGYIDITLTQKIQIKINGHTFNVKMYDNINLPTNRIRITRIMD